MIWSIKWCADGRYAWFVDGEYQLLCQVDLSSRRVNALSKIPTQAMDKVKNYSYCEKYGDMIFAYQIGERIFLYMNCLSRSGERLLLKIQTGSDIELILSLFLMAGIVLFRKA